VKSPTAIVRRQSQIQMIRDLFEQWLSDKLTTSVASYRIDLAAFGRFFQADDASSAFAKLIDLANKNHGAANAVLFAYRKDMLERAVWSSTASKRAGRPQDRVGLAPATINRRLAAIRSFVAIIRTAGQTAWLPEIPGIKHKQYRDTSGVGDEYVQILVDHLEAQVVNDLLSTSCRAKAMRDLVMIRLMAGMALRKNALLSLDYQNVDIQRKRVNVKLKGDRGRSWKLCDSITWEALVRWIDIRGAAPGPLFGSFHHGCLGARLDPSALNGILNTRSKEVNMQKTRPHGFRHTAITRALEMGLPLRDVSRFADHAKLDTTMIYDDRRQEPSRAVAQTISDYKKKSGQE
jgi:integrase/recombinase XerC